MICTLGNLLIQTPLSIPELPPQRSFRHQPQTDLIGDQDNAARRTLQGLDQETRFINNITMGECQIGKPQSQAIHQHSPPLSRMIGDGMRQVQRGFDRAPMLIALRLVMANARFHFRVKRLRCCDENAL